MWQVSWEDKVGIFICQFLDKLGVFVYNPSASLGKMEKTITNLAVKGLGEELCRRA